MYWSNSFATRFPKDIQREILLRLPYDDVLCLSQDPEFAWVHTDVDYWSTRANVERWMFTITTDAYPLLYLKLRYEHLALELLRPTLHIYGPEVSCVHWVNVLNKVLSNPDLSPDVRYEFARYILDRESKDRERIVDACIHYIVQHPRLLRWISTTGIHISSPFVCVVLSAYEFGGMSAIHCLENIATILWDNPSIRGVHRHLELVRYIVEKRKVDRCTLECVYENALRDGISDVVAYLKPHVGAY